MAKKEFRLILEAIPKGLFPKSPIINVLIPAVSAVAVKSEAKSASVLERI